MKTIDINEKHKVGYCISTELRDEQIKINLKKVKGRLGEPASELRTDPIAIVTFAPSLNETWEELKKFKYIMTCSGAHKFLIDKGIVPTWHVDLDPREHKIKLLGEPHKDVEYLIASTIHPKYLDVLKGYNVKLWHIFANEAEGAIVLPKGEWMITGGSSVGLRCMTLARFLGFTDFHIFGMDGSAREGKGAHTTEHPNAPQEYFETEYNGKKYLTTPSILFCAKETFKELDQMADVKATFYGEGLVQAMAKDYVPNKKKGSEIAYNKPTLISEEYLKLNEQLHQDNPQYGMGGSRHAQIVLDTMKNSPDIKSVLDYGCGKGMLARNIPFPIWEYDPAIPGKDTPPKPADFVVCTDVLEHIEPEKLNFVLDDLRRVTKQVGYFVISTRQAVKKYANGKNAHLIVQGRDWWEKKLSKFFEVAKVIEIKDELQIVVGPKTVKQPDITTAEKGDKKYKFYTPNDTTKWRAETLFKKEPATVEWLESLKPGEVLYDIGANIGSYSILGGVNGLKVYSFEPEAENYALLVKNMILNKLEPNAYCLALSDVEKPGTLYMGQEGVGGACHSFNEQVDFELKERVSPISQGSFGIPLDELVAKGLPSPDHIKIDVDGFEFKVIQGAQKVLANGVKSVLIEINPSIPQHKEMIKKMESLGFSYDPKQVEKAERKEGTFKGVAEYVFTKNKATTLEDYKKRDTTSLMNRVSVIKERDYQNPEEYDSDCIVEKEDLEIRAVIDKTEENLFYQADAVSDTAMELEPYNYLYVENFFSEADYKRLQEDLKKAEYVEIEKSRGTKGYPLRYTGKHPDWVADKLCNGRFKHALLRKFGIDDKGLVEDVLLVRDLPGYAIPPHTDSLRKVITVLIYLPEDESFVGEGTSIFEPKKKGFICKSGHHHKFEDFNKVKTMPFKPNSAFIFARTDNSFHGVEPCEHVRNVLLYNINRK